MVLDKDLPLEVQPWQATLLWRVQRISSNPSAGTGRIFATKKLIPTSPSSRFKRLSLVSRYRDRTPPVPARPLPLRVRFPSNPASLGPSGACSADERLRPCEGAGLASIRNTSNSRQYPVTLISLPNVYHWRLTHEANAKDRNGDCPLLRSPSPFAPQSFRFLMFTDLLSQHVPLEDVQYLAGHAHPPHHADLRSPAPACLPQYRRAGLRLIDPACRREALSRPQRGRGAPLTGTGVESNPAKRIVVPPC